MEDLRIITKYTIVGGQVCTECIHGHSNQEEEMNTKHLKYKSSMQKGHQLLVYSRPLDSLSQIETPLKTDCLSNESDA